MKFFGFLKEAFEVLKRNPKLFVPKLVVAGVYGVSLVLGAIILRDFMPIVASINNSSLTSEQLLFLSRSASFMLFSFFWLVFSLAVDVFVNAMYPVLLRDFKAKKSISFKRAFHSAWKRSLVVFPAVLLALLPLAILLETAFFLSSAPALFVFLIVALVAALLYGFAFYYIYPVLVLEKVSVFSGLKRSVSMSAANTPITLKASVIPFGVSLLNLYLAFDIFNPLNFFLFVTTRFFIAVLSTYNMVLNPVLYMGVKK